MIYIRLKKKEKHRKNGKIHKWHVKEKKKKEQMNELK